MRMTDRPSQGSPVDEVKELRELALNRRAASFNSFRQRLQKSPAAPKPKKDATTPAMKALYPIIAE
jgi:hypothetical protein